MTRPMLPTDHGDFQFNHFRPVMTGNMAFADWILNDSNEAIEVPLRASRRTFDYQTMTIPPHSFAHCVRIATDPQEYSTWQYFPADYWKEKLSHWFIYDKSKNEYDGRLLHCYVKQEKEHKCRR